MDLAFNSYLDLYINLKKQTERSVCQVIGGQKPHQKHYLTTL